MSYDHKAVGQVALVDNAPSWLIQLAGAVASVDRGEFFRCIDQYVAQVREASRDRALREARALIADFGLTAEDLGLSLKRTRAKVVDQASKGHRMVAKPTFRDPVTGITWSGRGRAPRWLLGKNKEDFRVSE